MAERPPADEGEDERKKACVFIRGMARDLEVSTTCTCTALALFHAHAAQRRRAALPQQEAEPWDGKGGEDGIEAWQVACAACVLASAKVNEAQRKVRDVVNVMHQRARMCELEVGQSFWRVRDRLVEGEHRLLKALGFSIKPELPFAYLLNYLKALSAPSHVAGFAHALLADSFDVPLTLEHPPHTVAAACIQVACMVLDHTLPTSNKMEWYHVLSVDEMELEGVSHALADVIEERARETATATDEGVGGG